MSEVIRLSAPATRESWEIPVLYEDAYLLALDKPAGLLTSPDRYDPVRPNLMKLLHAGIAQGKSWALGRGLTYLANAHRLDFETSGVLLLAKTKPVLAALANSFGNEKPVKRYAALVQGQPPQDRFTVTARLAPHSSKPDLVRVDPKRGKRAHTVFEVRERFAGWSLITCVPRADRTHQVRVHLQAVGLAIVADSLYGGKPLWLSRLKPDYRLKPNQVERPLLGRLALHAEELTLPHPVTEASLTITAPWPKDLRIAVKYLLRFGKKAFAGNRIAVE